MPSLEPRHKQHNTRSPEPLRLCSWHMFSQGKGQWWDSDSSEWLTWLNRERNRERKEKLLLNSSCKNRKDMLETTATEIQVNAAEIIVSLEEFISLHIVFNYFYARWCQCVACCLPVHVYFCAFSGKWRICVWPPGSYKYSICSS